MPRVLFVSYHFPPSNQVGARRAGRIARFLPDLGYEVDVVCASLGDAIGSVDPSQGWIGPAGASVTTVDTPFPLSRNPQRPPAADGGVETFWWKIRAYSERVFLTEDWSYRWGERVAKRFGRSLANGHYDLVIADGPPNPSVAPVLRLARRLGVPSVLDLRDMWVSRVPRFVRWAPASLTPFPGLRRELWNRRLRQESIRAADRIVVTTQEMADLLMEELRGLGNRRFVVVPNAFAVPDQGGLETKRQRNRSLRLVYTGSLAYGRALQMLQIIRALAKMRRETGQDFEVLVVGPVRPEMVEVARQEDLHGRLRMTGWVAREEAVAFQRGADALLLLQPFDKPATRVSTPAKLFEYMERRRNILGFVPPGPAAQIIEQYGLGVVVRSQEPVEIRKSLEELIGRIRSQPSLPPPPRCFSERETMAAFAKVLGGIAEHRD